MATRTFLLCLFLAQQLAGAAQDYALFHRGTARAFVHGNGPGPLYPMVLDSSLQVNTDTVLFNYFDLGSVDHEDTPCLGWGGPNCLRLDVPSWLGLAVVARSNGVYGFVTNTSDTLNIDPRSPFGDSLILYQDAEQRFRYTLSVSDTASYLGVNDSIRSYVILHEDITGQPITSPLHGTSFVIGKNSGLLEFFQVDSFPVVERHLELIGDGERDLGLHQLTPAVVHDYQPGDEIQYRAYSLSVPGGSTTNISKLTVLERNETEANVSYMMQREFFSEGDDEAQVTTVDQSFSKTFVMDSLPFIGFNGRFRSMSRQERCGLMIWIYSTEEAPGLGPCELDDCWMGVDTDGAYDETSNGSLIGVGNTFRFVHPSWTPGETYFTSLTTIPYFKKNGVACGVELNVGLLERQRTAPQLHVSPNPSNGTFQLGNISSRSTVRIFDTSGRTVLAGPVGTDGIISDTQLNTGVYLIQCTGSDGMEQYGRISITY